MVQLDQNLAIGDLALRLGRRAKLLQLLRGLSFLRLHFSGGAVGRAEGAQDAGHFGVGFAPTGIAECRRLEGGLGWAVQFGGHFGLAPFTVVLFFCRNGGRPGWDLGSFP